VLARGGQTGATHALTHCERCAKTWKVNKESGEGLSDFFSYFGKIMQKGKRG
jgi:hypothetical protein